MRHTMPQTETITMSYPLIYDWHKNCKYIKRIQNILEVEEF